MEKENRRSSYRIGVGGILIRVALVALVLVLLSVHLMGGLFAKYTSNAEGSDEARVAKFDVEVTGNATADVEIISDPLNDTAAYQITITNQSEVAVHYNISVTYKNTVPGVTHSFDADSGDLAVGLASATHTLTFSVTDWAAFTKNKTGASATDTLNFTVTVNVVQVD